VTAFQFILVQNHEVREWY